MRSQHYKLIYDIIQDIRAKRATPLPQAVVDTLSKYFPNHVINFLTGPSYELFMHSRKHLRTAVSHIFYYPTYFNQKNPNQKWLELYRSTYYHDDPEQPNNLPDHLRGKAVITWEDFTGADAVKAKTIRKFWDRCGLPHKCSIYLYEKDVCMAGIGMMRAEKLGPFTKDELEIFAALAEAIGPIYYDYLRASFHANMSNIFSNYCDEQQTGLAIVTYNANLLEANKHFSTICAEMVAGLEDQLSKAKNENDISRVLQILIHAYAPITSQVERTIVSNGTRYHCTLKPIIFTGLSVNIQTVYLLRIQKMNSSILNTTHPLLVQYGLTSREVEVIELLISGHKTSQIASALNISPYTVKNHISSIFKKIGVANRVELCSKLGQP